MRKHVTIHKPDDTVHRYIPFTRLQNSLLTRASVQSGGTCLATSGFWWATGRTDPRVMLNFNGSGRGTLALRDATYALEEGTVVVVPGGTPYRCECAEPPWYSVWFYCHAAGPFEQLAAGGVLHRETKLLKDLDYAVNRLIDEVEYAGEGGNRLVQVLDELVLQLLLCEFGRGRDRARQVQRQDLLEVVTDSYRASGKWPQVPALARKMGLSVSSLHRRAKRLFGLSAGALVRQLRLNNAAEMLTQSSLTTREIAVRNGYCDEFSFSNAFKAFHGCRPRDFRRRAAAHPTRTDTDEHGPAELLPANPCSSV